MSAALLLLSMSLSAFTKLVHSAAAEGTCPYLLDGTPKEQRAAVPSESVYSAALDTLDVAAVFADLYELNLESQECWPSDEIFGESSYGPLFIRLAWHCAGSFRISDGLGGCAGGRMRFPPESAWDDNTNLDKARALLGGIKEKYGDALSWGDLFVFAGTAAIMQGNGPVSEVCYGRMDDVNGNKSDLLGPTPEQEAAFPCDQPGNCTSPLGTQQVGLIYVNPEGFLGNPDPVETAPHIREVFSRMGMNDTETVALIGGGHAFGKCHGACSDVANPAGLNPLEEPLDPWNGNCGSTGKGADTFTSGLEGPWTSTPFAWSNQYFTLLRDSTYTLETGSGGKQQWRNDDIDSLIMLTTDLALVNDDDYNTIVESFAADATVLDRHFAAAWAKLVTQGAEENWATNKNCMDGETLRTEIEAVLAATDEPMSTAEVTDEPVSTAEVVTCPFLLQGTPLASSLPDDTVPDKATYLAALETLDVAAVFKDLYDAMLDSQECWPADEINGESSYGPLFIRLAWHCSGSYRESDGLGGCAGGRMRFSPEASWDDNTNLDKARALLGEIKDKYGDALSWGDLFVFAGTAAIMQGDGPVSEVCYGRMDDVDGTDSILLGPSAEQEAQFPCAEPGNCELPLGTQQVGLIYVNPEGFLGNPDPVETAPHVREVFSRMGFNDSETVALIGGGHAFGKCHGACPKGAGPNPEEQPNNPWPGLCGTGKGDDTFTSGLEGVWTHTPFAWSNQFFTLLNEVAAGTTTYTLETGSGGKQQWTNDADDSLFMLTTDLSLVKDDAFKAIVQSFAEDINVLNDAFSAAWAKLVTNGAAEKWAEKKCMPGADIKAAVDELIMNEDTNTDTNTDDTDGTDGGNDEPEEKSAGMIGQISVCSVLFAMIVCLHALFL